MAQGSTKADGGSLGVRAGVYIALLYRVYTGAGIWRLGTIKREGWSRKARQRLEEMEEGELLIN